MLPQRFEPQKLVAVLAVFLLAMVAWTAPSAADLGDDIDRANRQTGLAESSRVDVATADIGQITEQLKALNRQVALSASKKKKLDAERKQLGGQASDFEAEIAEIQDEIDELTIALSGRAIDSFKSQNDNSILVIERNPTDSIRKHKLSSSISKNEIETAEELRQKKADLAAKETAKEDLKKKLDADTAENKRSLQKFEAARTAVVGLAEAAEERAERTLSEAQGLEGIDKVRADALRKSAEGLGEQIRIALKDQVKKRQENPFAPTTIDGFVPDSDTRLATNNIRVHKDILEQVNAMLAAAALDGVTLRGGGYRSHTRQIELRRKHCGTSDYAIYQAPSRACTPMTARPGFSQHEKGLAIDFTNGNGATIRAGSAGYVWLTNNAAAYGFKNLPGETWHWSTTGR